MDKLFNFTSNASSSELWPPRFYTTMSMVESWKTGSVWSNGNVHKEPHWPNLWLQPKGRSLPNTSGCAQCVLTVPMLTHDRFLCLLPWEVSLRCHKERSFLRTQCLGIRGKRMSFQSLAPHTPSASIANSFSLGKTQIVRFYRSWSHLSLAAGTVWQGEGRKRVWMDSLLPENHCNP